MTRTVVALGGNTLLRRGEGTIAEQRSRIRETLPALDALSDGEGDLVLTHGNGPQVGALLLQQEADGGPARPLDVLVAETQAQIGYLLQQELDNRLDDVAVSVVSQTVVDADDPAFDEPTKPIGPFYTDAEAAEKPFETTEVRRSDGTPARRRIVPSPAPVRVVESGRVRELVETGAVVVAAGGGGVPVVETADGDLRGVEAVVDKDHASRVLAEAVGASRLVVLTDVEAVYLDYGGPDQRALGEVTPADLRRHLDSGEFAAGSMKPKVEACAAFVEAGGDAAIITSPERLPDALVGEAGTRVRA